MKLIARAPFLACAAASLTLAGCGSSSSSPTTSSTASTAATAPAAGAPGTTLALQANPTGQLTYVQSTLATKSGRVTIDFSNTSGIQHNVAVAQGAKLLGQTPVVSGTHVLMLTLAKGTYTYYCTVPGHRQAGMQGTLTVS